MIPYNFPNRLSYNKDVPNKTELMNEFSILAEINFYNSEL